MRSVEVVLCGPDDEDLTVDVRYCVVGRDGIELDSVVGPDGRELSVSAAHEDAIYRAAWADFEAAEAASAP